MHQRSATARRTATDVVGKSAVKATQRKHSKRLIAVMVGFLFAVGVIGGISHHILVQSSMPSPLSVSATNTTGIAAVPPLSSQSPSSPEQQYNDRTARSHGKRFLVSSTTQITQICHDQAPALEKTPWYVRFLETDRDVILATPLPEAHTYLFMPYPVCLHLGTGRMFAEHASKRISVVQHRQHEIPLYLRNAGFYDLEELFAGGRQGEAMGQPPSVQLIPALSLMPFGSFMATHMWHLIHDGIGPIIDALDHVAPNFWDIPRQAILSDEKGARWIDRNGDLPHKMALSAMIVNGLSTFINSTVSRNGSAPPVPAFVEKPLIAHSVDRPPDVLRGAFPDIASQTVCFCQNMFAPPYGKPGQPPSPLAINTIQNRTALSFGARPYRNLTEESVWDIERQRIERYPPWARQFWPATTTAAAAHTAQTAQTAVYQPRVLFIHRAKRTIANVAAYVRAMRDLGFRVEEVYLERLPTDQQYYLGRYADVVVGMHGLGIGHALWMNRYPTGCRTVIEFRLWAGEGIPIGLETVLKSRAGFHYLTPEPVDVVFGPSVANPLAARHRIKAMGHAGYTHPGWDDQEAVFDDADVVRTLQDVKAHLDQCLMNPTKE